MLIHLSIFALIIILGIIYEKKIKFVKVNSLLEGNALTDTKAQLLPWVLLFSLIVFYAYARTYINDTHVYMNTFIQLQPSWDNITEIINDTSKDKGFYILQNLFKMYISSDYHNWFLFIAIVESVLLISVLRRRTVSFFDGMFFFFAGELYYNYFSMMRQWLAVCIFFTGIHFIEKRKFIPFLLICLLAGQFHNSAYFLIITYFLVQGSTFGKKQLFIILGFSIALVLLQPILNTLESNTQNDTYGYVVQSMISNKGSSIFRPLINFIPVILSFMIRDKIQDKTIAICVNFSILCFLLSFLATFTSGIYIIRIATYMKIFSIILYSYLFSVAYRDHPNINLFRYLYYGGFLLYYFIDMNYSGAFPYQSDIIGYFG